MRVLTVFAGVLLVSAGVFAIANQGVSFISIAFIIGLVMAVAGIIQCSGYIYGRYTGREDGTPVEPDDLAPETREAVKAQKNAHGWIMIDGTVTFTLGALVLSDQLKAEVAVISVFGLWMLTAGIRRIVTATYIDRHAKMTNFYWTLGTGIASALAGIYAFYNGTIFQMPLSSLIGVFFVLQGISTLELGIHMPHKRRPRSFLDDIEDMFHKKASDLAGMKKQDLIDFAEERKIPVKKSGTRAEIAGAIENALKYVGKRKK